MSETSGRLIAASKQHTYTGLPYTTVRDLALAGKLPYVQIGRRWYYDKADLDKFIAKNKQTLGGRA